MSFNQNVILKLDFESDGFVAMHTVFESQMEDLVPIQVDFDSFSANYFEYCTVIELLEEA